MAILCDGLLKLVQRDLLMCKLMHKLQDLIYLLLPRKGLAAEGKGNFFYLSKSVEEPQKDESEDDDIGNADS